MNRSSRMDDEIRISLLESWDNENAVVATMEFASRIGFGKTDQAMIATAVSELATNILRYAVKGEIFLRVLRKIDCVGIEVLAIDNGPGIKNIEMALLDGFSTTKGSLGLGLPSVRRIMDEFEIESSSERGTRVLTRKWRSDAKS